MPVFGVLRKAPRAGRAYRFENAAPQLSSRTDCKSDPGPMGSCYDGMHLPTAPAMGPG